MNAKPQLSAGWACIAWPIGWDPSTRTAPMAATEDSNLPARFCLSVHTPDMDAPGTAILFAFEVRDGSITLSQISSVGEEVTAHLVTVLARHSPQEWQQIAVDQITAYSVDAPARQSTDQVRRRLTSDHLEEVSAVYRRALMQDKAPTRAVQDRFDVSHSTAAKWVGHARKAGLLPKTTKGAAA